MIAKGKPLGWTAQREGDHFMRCPVCHKWFDMRDLRDAFEHWHDGPENDRPLPPQGHRPPAGHQ
jgi:hypothetical protein